MSDQPEAPDGASIMEVHLLRVPVPVWARAQEHGDELLREFTLIAEQLRRDGNHSELPVRLTELVAALTSRYGNLSAGQEAQLAEAARIGQAEIPDLTFYLPSHAAEAATLLGDILDDVDTYCRAGRHLLTLASPPEVVRFRTWYLGEFVRQAVGQAPVSWPDYPD